LAYRRFRELLRRQPNHQAAKYNHAMTRAVLAQIDPRTLEELEQEDAEKKKEQKNQEKSQQNEENQQQQDQQNPEKQQQQDEQDVGDEKKPQDELIETGSDVSTGSANEMGDAEDKSTSGETEKKGDEEKSTSNIGESGGNVDKSRQNSNDSGIDTGINPISQEDQPKGVGVLKTAKEKMIPWLKQIEAKRVQLLRYQFQQQKQSNQSGGALEEERPW